MQRLSQRLIMLLASALAHPLRAAIEVPPGFVAENLASGLNAATAIAPAADGRIFIADQTGPLRVWKDGRVLERPALDLSDRLDTYWERGLIGVTLHPEFPRVPHVFVMYIAKAPFTHHVISRFTMTGDVIDPASELVLLRGDDQRRYPGSHPHGHQGGPLRFGPDGKLYATIGEQTAGKPSQELDNVLGKMLRLNPDGTIPEDNPFYTRAEGKYRAIYAIGLRNVFGLAFQPDTHRLFVTDVGQTSWEEVNEIFRGANYGWPEVEGLSSKPGYINPLHVYPPVIGRSIVGAAFHPPVGNTPARFTPFPERWRGQLFFGDWAANWLKTMTPDVPHAVSNFARGFSGPVAVEFAPDNSLLVLERGTIWIDRVKFASNAGALTRIRYTGENAIATSAALPPRLSATGIFRDLAKLEPSVGFEPFELNAPVWLPGVTARRWISVPGDGAITIAADGEARLPAGAVVVQHFATLDGAPFETHVYWFTEDLPRAGAYRWTADRRDALLVSEAEIVPLPGNSGRQWHSPGAETQLDQAATVSGFVLQLNVAQLNRAVPMPPSPVFGGRRAAEARINQLALWNRRGWLAAPLSAKEIERLPRLAALDDTDAPLELRVRSYLEANCASCHRPGGPSRALFDARAHRPIGEAGMIDAAPIAGDMGIPGARIVAPGTPEKSLLLTRLLDTGAFRMPPVRLTDETQPVVPYLEEWIRSMAK